MMDEEIRQALCEVREMKKMCGNINMKLTNIVTQRGQDYKKKLEAEYQRGLEDGKWKSEDGCTGCKYEGKTGEHLPCEYCKNNFRSQWTAKDDKIEVGDEVKHKSEGVTWTAIVTRIRCGTLTLMGHSGASADNYPIEDFVKTGRHFDIASILEDMRND